MLRNMFPPTKTWRGIDDCFFSKLDPPGPRIPLAARLIKSNVAIPPDSQQLPVNPARCRNFRLIFQGSHRRIIVT